MKRQDNWQAALHAKRTPHLVQLQSRQIEQVFSRHDVSAQIAGGHVSSRQVQFDLQAPVESGLNLLRGLKQELLAVLGVSDVQFTRNGGQFGLRVTRPEETPVPLLSLMPLLPQVGPATAVLGMSEQGDPVLLELLSGDVGHVLILGDTAAGKTSLLRTIAASLAMNNRQSQVQIVAISVSEAANNNGFSTLAPLSHLPHLLEPVVLDAVNALALLDFLVEEVDYRLTQQVVTPTIVVLIDRLVSLLDFGDDAAVDALLFLLQQGSDAGVHLVMASSKPDSEQLGVIIHACEPLRIVGRIEDEQVAEVIGGGMDIYPDYLLGEGDFLAIAGEEVTHFQAAFIGDYDLRLLLDTLRRNRPQPLLARAVAVEDDSVVDVPEVDDDTSGEDVIPFDVGKTLYLLDEDEQDE